MSNNGKTWRYLVLFLLLFIAISCLKRDITGNASHSSEYLLFETFELNSGMKISIREILAADRVVFMNFWGVRCISCLEEIEELNKLYLTTFKGSRIEFLAVNTDGLETAELRKAISDHKIDIRFPIVPDPDMEISNFYTNGLIPYNVIISRDGGKESEIVGFNEKLFKKLKDKLFELAGNVYSTDSKEGKRRGENRSATEK